MQSKNYPPNAAQKRFHKWIRETFTACNNCGATATEIHHIVGAAGKHDRQWIGQWAVEPICYGCNHDNLYLPKKRDQLNRFLETVLRKYITTFGRLPDGMTEQQREAIRTWRR